MYIEAFAISLLLVPHTLKNFSFYFEDTRFLTTHPNYHLDHYHVTIIQSFTKPFPPKLFDKPKELQ